MLVSPNRQFILSHLKMPTTKTSNSLRSEPPVYVSGWSSFMLALVNTDLSGSVCCPSASTAHIIHAIPSYYSNNASFIVIFLYFIWYKKYLIFCIFLKTVWGVCMYMWTGHLCSSTWDVTKHGDRSPSPTGVSWVSDGVSIDSREIYAYQRCSLLM